MRKRINKILWYGDELLDEKAKAPGAATSADGLDGLNEGEIYISNNEKDPALFIRTSSGKVVRVGSDNLFKLVQDEQGNYYIHTPYPLASDSTVSSLGVGEDEGGIGGATALYQLVDVLRDGDKVSGAEDGNVLMFDAATGKWYGKKVNLPDVDFSELEGQLVEVNSLIKALQTKDTAIEQSVTSLQGQLNTLVSGDASSAIESFNEVVEFLKDMEDDSTLEGILAGKQNKITETNKLDYSLIANTPSLADFMGSSAIGGTASSENFSAVYWDGTQWKTRTIYKWALASVKPSYTTSDVTEGTRLYFTDDRAKTALKSTTDSLSDRIAVFEKMFQWGDGDGSHIKTPYSFASDKTVSSLGVGSDGTGGVSYDRLDSWDSYTSDKSGYVLSASLGWDLKTRLDNLDIGDFDLSGYQPLISATNKLSYSLLDGAPTSLKNPYALKFGSKSYDGSEEKTVTAADLGALTEHQTIYALTIKDSAGKAQLTYTPNVKAGEITLTKAMVGLGLVENTALSTWKGTTNITTLGTVTSGTWKGTKIANDYIANPHVTIAGNKVNLGGSLSLATLQTSLDMVTLSTEQTITGKKTFTKQAVFSNGIQIGNDGAFLWWDGEALRVNKPFASDSTVSSLGVGEDGGEGVHFDILQSWDNYTDGEVMALGANLGYELKQAIENINIGAYLTKSEAENTYATIRSLDSVISRVGNIESTYVISSDLGDFAYKNSLSASDIPSIPWSKITSGKPTSLSGYGITDAYTKEEVNNAIGEVDKRIDTLVGSSASKAIDTFNEVVAFLKDIEDTETLEGILAGKQDTITDLATIRANAALGATALQSSDLDGYVNEIATSGSGNAITSVTKSGKKLTFNKASSFFLAGNFTKANIKSTLGISDWALASSKPSYKTSEVTEEGNLYFTTDRVKNCLTGAISTVLTSNLTASRALISNASGKIAVSAVTSTELGYLDGVTSAVQTQLNALSARIKAYEDILKIEENNTLLHATVAFASDSTVSSLGVGSDDEGNIGGVIDLTNVVTNIVPSMDGLNIGSASSRWSKLYVTRIENSQDDLYLDSGGYIRMLTDVVFGNNDNFSISPTGTAYLGNIYSNGNIVATLGDIDSKLSGYALKSEVYSGVISGETENGYYKISLSYGNGVGTNALIPSYSALGFTNIEQAEGYYLADQFLINDILDYVDNAVKNVNVNVDLSNYYTKTQVHTYVSQELNTFSEENLGTALQNYFPLSGNKTITGKVTISSAGFLEVQGNVYVGGTLYSGLGNNNPYATQGWVKNQGYTSNIGTVTGVRINGSTKNPSSGIVDLGFVASYEAIADVVEDYLTYDYSLSSDTTDAVKLTTLLGRSQSITAATLKNSLGLKALAYKDSIDLSAYAKTSQLENYYTKTAADSAFAKVEEIETLVADEIGLYLPNNFSVASNTTNAVSVTIGSNTENISAATLKTSLGLGGAAYKAVGAVASGNTGLVTGGAVYTAIKNVSDIVTDINDNYASVDYVDSEIEILEGDLAAFITATEVDTKLQSYATKATTLAGYGIKDGISTGNIGSQSVNYANSAGNADNATKWGGFEYYNIVNDNSNNAPYFKLITIRITSTYVNSVVSFDVSGRGKGVAHIEVYPNGKPSIGEIGVARVEVTGNSSFADTIRAYTIGNETDSSGNIIAKVIEVWYVKQQRSYDSVVVQNVHWGQGESVEINCSKYAALPTSYESYVDATMGSIYGSITKLTTPRIIWGRSFDGTKDVSGDLVLWKTNSIKVTDTTGTSHTALQLNNGNTLLIGQDVAKAGYDTVLYGNTIKLAYGNYGTSAYSALVVNSSGNVTIGSSDLASTNYKLYVDGKIRMTNSLIVGTSDAAEVLLQRTGYNYIWANSAGGTLVFGVKDVGVTGPQYASLLIQATEITPGTRNNAVNLGTTSYRWRGIYGQALNLTGNIEFVTSTSAGHGGYIDFHYNGSTSDYTSRFIEDSSGSLCFYADYGRFKGAVTIGSTSNLAGTTHKLYVNGSTYIDSALGVAANLSVKGSAAVSGTLSIGGETAATQSWVTNEGYATTTSVNNSLGSLAVEISAVDARIDALGTAASKNWSGASSADTTNLVTIGWVETKLGGYATSTSIPTKTSQLTNDSRFISGSIETTVIGGGTGLVTGGAVYSFVEGSLSGYAKKATTLSGYGITDALPKSNPSVTGTLTVAGNVLPSNNNDTYALGSANYRWSKLYANGVDCTGVISSMTNISAYNNVTAINGGLSGKTLSVSGAASVGSLTVGGAVHSNLNIGGYRIKTEGGDIYGVYDGLDKLLYFDASAAFCSAFVQTSDERLKNILNGDFRLSLATMACAPLIIFDWNNRSNRKHNVGTIAQYWQGALPEVVSKTQNGTLALAYGELGVAMGISLANILEDTNGRVATVEEEIKTLKEENKRLKERVAELEAA